MTEIYRIGCVVTDTLAGKTLKVGVECASLNNSGACFLVNGANYQVAAGKTLYITGVLPVGIVAARDIEMRYATNAALTGTPITLMTLNTSAAGTPAFSAGTLNGFLPVLLTVPAGMYVGVFQSTAVATTSYVIFIGYEA